MATIKKETYKPRRKNFPLVTELTEIFLYVATLRLKICRLYVIGKYSSYRSAKSLLEVLVRAFLSCVKMNVLSVRYGDRCKYFFSEKNKAGGSNLQLRLGLELGKQCSFS
jgi:hypothetical protein